LVCKDNLLEELPKLPEGLNYLNCRGNFLKDLHHLPKTIIYLNCSNNELTELPELPNLREFWCQINKLTKLPKLSNNLIQLYCNDNELKELPELPDSLTHLNCGSNELTTLPKLGKNLEYLFAFNNKLTFLPYLPFSSEKRSRELKFAPVPFSLKDVYLEDNQFQGMIPFIKLNHQLGLKKSEDVFVTYEQKCLDELALIQKTFREKFKLNKIKRQIMARIIQKKYIEHFYRPGGYKCNKLYQEAIALTSKN
jgi:Leucine-rich repeat (LRR) protein